MRIDPTTLLPGAGQSRSGGPTTNLIQDLGDSFSRMLNDVNHAQLEADRKIEAFATSQDKDIHGTMIAMEEAGISLRLLLQIRAKLTNAYHEIMRMQL